jgi:sugar phosphate permease
MREKLSVIKYGVLLTKKGFVVNLILSFVFYTTYFVFSFYIPRYFILSADNRLIVQAAFNFVIATTLLITSFFIHRSNKLRVIYTCFIATSISTVFLFLAPTEILSLIFFFAIAIFFSTGQLAFFTYFWNLTVPEERGRIAGFIGFISLPFYLVVQTAIVEPLDFQGTAMLAIILSLGALAVTLLTPNKAMMTAKKEERGNYPEKRIIILYSVPWILFSLINATLAKNISLNISQQVPSSFYLLLIVFQGIATVFGALSGGILADLSGRRLSLAFSLTLYGTSSALAGIVNNYPIFCFVYVANGLSWGILLTLYTFVVWGDLANKKNCARMYSIGLITFYLTIGAGLLPTQISQISLVVSSLVSCALIFLSNIPIFLAPELISSNFREKIKLILHMHTVRKIGKKSRNQG